MFDMCAVEGGKKRKRDKKKKEKLSPEEEADLKHQQVSPKLCIIAHWGSVRLEIGSQTRACSRSVVGNLDSLGSELLQFASCHPSKAIHLWRPRGPGPTPPLCMSQAIYLITGIVWLSHEYWKMHNHEKAT